MGICSGITIFKENVRIFTLTYRRILLFGLSVLSTLTVTCWHDDSFSAWIEVSKTNAQYRVNNAFCKSVRPHFFTNRFGNWEESPFLPFFVLSIWCVIECWIFFSPSTCFKQYCIYALPCVASKITKLMWFSCHISQFFRSLELNDID